MSELVCIYCKARNEIDAEACAACGIPLTVSRAEGTTPYRNFTNYQMDEESSLIPKVKAIAVLVLTVCICVVGVILQNSGTAPEQQQLEGDRIILDQNVGKVVEMPKEEPTKLEAAKQLIEQKKKEEAIKILMDIQPEDPDYKQAQDLLKDLKKNQK